MHKIFKKIRDNKLSFFLFTSLIIFQIILPIINELLDIHSVYIFTAFSFEISYLLLALLIFNHRSSLLQFNIGLFELILFITFPIIIPLISELAAPSVYGSYKYFHCSIHIYKFNWALIISAVILLIMLIINRKEVTLRKSAKTSTINLLLFIVLIAALCSTYVFLDVNSDNYTIKKNVFAYMYLSKLPGTIIITEFVYRSILWGYLKLISLKDKYIWIIQGMVYYIVYLILFNNSNDLSSLISPAVIGLALGAVVWRTRSIFTSVLIISIITYVNLLFTLVIHL